MSLRPDDARARRPPGADRLAHVLRAGLRFTEQARGTGAPNDEYTSPLFRSLPSELWNEIMAHLANADEACTSVPELCGILKVLLGRYSTDPNLLDVCNSAEFWRRACEYIGWTYDSEAYVPPIDGWDGEHDLARWREQYLLFCSTAHGLTNQLYLALYRKLVRTAFTEFDSMYEKSYGHTFDEIRLDDDQLKSKFPAFYEFKRIKEKAASDSTWGDGQEVFELYTNKDPDNRKSMGYGYTPSSPSYSPTSPSYTDYDATTVQLPAGMRDNGANATFGSIVNTVGECSTWAIRIAIAHGFSDDLGDTFAFDPSLRHVHYLTSMIHNVAMVGAKHCVRIYENRPTSRDPSSVQAWQAHSNRYNQVVDEFRKIVMKTPAAVWPNEHEVRQKKRKLGLSFSGNVKVDEERPDFGL